MFIFEFDFAQNFSDFNLHLNNELTHLQIKIKKR